MSVNVFCKPAGVGRHVGWQWYNVCQFPVGLFVFISHGDCMLWQKQQQQQTLRKFIYKTSPTRLTQCVHMKVKTNTIFLCFMRAVVYVIYIMTVGNK